MQNPLKAKNIKDSLHLLEELKLISINSDGSASTKKEDVTSGDEVKSLAVIRFHHKFMDLAKNSIAETTEAFREIDSLTFCISRADVGEYKKEIRSFLRKINKLSKQKGKHDEVYQLNLQFFPLTKKRGNQQ